MYLMRRTFPLRMTRPGGYQPQPLPSARIERRSSLLEIGREGNHSFPTGVPRRIARVCAMTFTPIDSQGLTLERRRFGTINC